MRLTPLPLLRDLAPGRVVVRCPGCHELVLMHEACKDEAETKGCPPRSKLEGRPAKH